MTRLLFTLGLLAVLIGIMLNGSSLGQLGPTSAQGVQRVVLRQAAPACQETVEGMALEGQPVGCIEPPAATHDPPRMHGDYRLFPGSYVGPLTYEDSPDTAPPGVASQGIGGIRASSMYGGANCRQAPRLDGET
jgi:hypothetical protein